jgi:hypothetical protein
MASFKRTCGLVQTGTEAAQDQRENNKDRGLKQRKTFDEN